VGLRLEPAEETWLASFQRELNNSFGDHVTEIRVFGSKARGDATPDSDLDVLVLLRAASREDKRAVRHLGHRLAVMTDVVPSIMVYSEEEWRSRERARSRFYAAVTRDGIRIG
jgi:predicted nucleotidyltransferase